jgi:glycosyltransferase involved in cell wall biosynthesis
VVRDTAIPPPLSVACVGSSSAFGGPERSLLDFAARASRHGIAAHVIVPTEGPLTAALRDVGASVGVAQAPEAFLDVHQGTTLTAERLTDLATGLWRWSRAVRAELDALERGPTGRPAVLYSNSIKAHLACALLPGYTRVWHLHEFPPPVFGPIWRVAAFALPTAVLAPSPSTADAWRGLLGPKPVVVTNGVDLDRFKPAPRTFWIHDQLDLPHEAALIGMPAVFARWKGHLLVVEAFEQAAADLENVHLVLVGGPMYDTVAERGYAEELSRRVRRASVGGQPNASTLSDRIHFVRFQNDPWRLYPEFDVVVHFSTLPEPFGRVVVEAMACGTPVIAARSGGPAEVIEDGVQGWLTTPGDTKQLARTMQTALAGDLRAVGAAGRVQAEALFSADRFAAEVAQALRGAAQG